MKRTALTTFAVAVATVSLALLSGLSYAAMGGGYGNMPGNSYGPGDFDQHMTGGGPNGNGFSMMDGGGPAMTRNGGFGMMNGLAGAPVVDDEGIAYFITTNRTNDPSTVPDSNSFTSNILAVNPGGGGVSVTLQGIVSRPVGQSVIYAFTLPLTETSEPIAVSMDGRFASIPVITNDRIYVTTTDFGRAMFNGFINDIDDLTAAKTYLYVFNLDGTLESRTEIQ
jgi:hypothetical protein